MRQRFEYRDANRKAAYAATRRSRVGQRTFNVLALALLFVLVFSLALVAVVGGANGKFNVAEAASTWSPSDTSGTLTFDTSAQCNYIEMTQNDQGAIPDGGKFKFRSSTENSHYTKHTNSYGMFQESDGGDINVTVRVKVTLGGTSSTWYRVTSSAVVTLWSGGSGSSNVSTMATIMTAYTSYNNSSAPIFNNDLTGKKVDGGSGSYKSAVSSTVNSNNYIYIKGGTDFYIYAHFRSTDDRKIASTVRAMFLDSISFTASSVTSLSKSSVSKTGTELVPSLSKTDFNVDTELAGGASNFQKNTAESNGWGFVDLGGSDQAHIAFLQFDFSDTLLDLVKLGIVSWQVSAKSDFDDGLNDENSVAISYVGVHDAPTVNFVSGSRSGDSASWSGSAYAWKGSWSNGNGTFSNGSSSFNSSTEIPQNATGIRIIFGYIADGSLDGGFYDISLKLYSAWNGAGTSSDPFKLTNKADFDTLRHKVNGTDGTNACPSGAQKFSGKYFKMTNDVALSTFTAIGTDNNSFNGTLDGGNFAITSMTISNSGYVGLFAYISGATIKNISFTSPSVSSTSSSGGIVAGRAYGTVTLENITVNNGSLKNSHQAGALIGYKEAGTLNITNCHNKGCTITTSGVHGDSAQQNRSSTAGLVGLVNGDCNFTIKDSSNSGTVTASAANNTGVGGIVGYCHTANYSHFTITNCTNSGAITGGAAVGGIVGYSEVSSKYASFGINQCANTGTIHSTGHYALNSGDNAAYLGGIIGYGSKVYIKNCYNSGSVSTYNGSAEGSYDYANTVGGIAGYSGAYIDDVYNKGRVGGANNLGGIVGQADGATLRRDYIDCTIHGYWDNDGAAIGYTVGKTTGTVAQTYIWRLPNAKVEGATSAALGKVAEVGRLLNIPSGSSSYVKYYPATSTSDATRSDWTDIAAISFSITTLRLNATIADTYYFRLTKDEGDEVYAPSKITSSLSGTTYTINAYYDGNENATDTLYAARQSIGWKSAEIVYDEDQTIDPLSLFSSPPKCFAYDANQLGQYGAQFDIQFTRVRETAKSSVDNLQEAGSYAIDATLYIGSAAVGHVKKTNIVRPKTIVVTWQWMKNKSGVTSNNPTTTNNFTYSGAYQGLNSLSFTTNWLEGTFAITPSEDTASSTQLGVLPDDLKEFLQVSGSFQAKYWKQGEYASNAYAYMFNLKKSDTYAENSNYQLRYQGTVTSPTYTDDISLYYNIEKLVLTLTSEWLLTQNSVDTNHKNTFDRTTNNPFTYSRTDQGIRVIFPIAGLSDDFFTDIFENFTLTFETAVGSYQLPLRERSNNSGGNGYIGAALGTDGNLQLESTGIDANSSGNYVLSFTMQDSRAAQSYDIKKSGESASLAQTGTLAQWTIAPKTIEGAGTSNNNDVLFGHGGATYEKSFATNTSEVTAASLGKSGGTYFSLIGNPEGATPILYYNETITKLYNNLTNYIIYFAGAALKNGTDFTATGSENVKIDGVDITFTFDSDGIALVSLTFAGVGNFTGEFSRTFYLMQHDFASETETYDATWGTAENPYFIKTEQQFLRLSTIVNAAKHGSVKAWDSLTGDNSVLGGTGFVKATKRSYEGAYFKLAADKEFTLSLDMGFEPIGYAALDGKGNIDQAESYPFSASFDGNSSHIKLTLSYSSGQSYMGLFGYLSAGETEEKPYVINMNITANLSATLGTGVGAIAGYAVGYNIYGDNSLSTTIRVPNGKELGGAIGNAQNCDFGYAPEGFAGTNRIFVGGNGGISSYSNYIGGVFGRVNNCRVFHVADGNPAGTTPEDEAFVISSVAPVNANLSGGQSMYVGGIAGEWILGAGDAAEQFNDSIRLDAGNLVVIGSAYVGGIVGYFDASAAVPTEGRTSHLVYTPHIAYGSGFSINIYANYMVGGLFGVFVGNGYRDTSDSLDVLSKYTKIVLSPSNVKLKVNLGVIPESDSSGKGSAIGVGGLFGYVGGAGVLFTDDWDAASQTPIAAASNYTVESVKVMGSIAGVIGNNATLESSTQDGAGETGKPVQITVGSSAFGSLKASVWGAIAGAVANTAGTFNGTAITVFGNRIALVNRFDFSSNSSNDYVGGLFGVLGKLPQEAANGLGIGSMFSDLVNVLWSGVFDAESSVVASGNYVAFAPQIESNGIVPAGYGRAINTASVSGHDYVGGLVGYVGDGGRLDLANRAYTSRPSGTGLDEILDVFVGNPALNNGTSKSVQGRQHVGGIAGYLAAGTHMIDRMVTRLSFVCSTISGGNYIGGYFGDMGGGTVQNSLVLYNSSSQNLSVGNNVVAYASANSSAYVGGIAGMAQGVTASNTYVMNFQYSTLSDTKGGIFGSSDASSSATSAWALMMTSSGATTTTTTSANSNGKYVIFDADALNNGAIPNFDQLAVMTGIYAFDVGNQANEVESDYNKAEYGKLSFAAITPATNSQLALVDGNGNTTKIAFDSFRNGKAIGYGSSNENRQTVMFKMSNASDSLVVAVVDIVIKDIPKDMASAKDTMTDPSYANSYRPPLADRNFYRISYGSGSMYVEFDANGNAKKVKTNVISPKGVGVGATNVTLGNYEKELKVGSSDTPITISNINEWKSFITGFSSNNKYSGMYVKLLADIGYGSGTSGTDSGSPLNLASSTFVASNFAGTFDGNGHKIKVSYSGSGNGISLFPYANGATFKNLTIEGTINAASSLGDYNTASYGTGGDYGTDWDKGCGTAAFVGSPDGTVTFENCTNAATVTGTKDVGGFVGRINKGTKYTFVTCVNKGAIKSITGQHTEQYASYPFGVGGIIGRSTISLTIESCRNVGNVTGGHNVGGIIGLCMGDLTVYNSANTGTIFAHIGDETLWDNAANGNDVNGIFGYAGGIVGRTGGRVDPSSKDSAGIGSLSAYACYNTGEIKCTGNVAGGIAGATCEIIPNATAFVTQKDLVYVGSKGTKIAYCYNTGNVTVGAKNALYADNYTLGGRCEFGGTIAGGIVGVWSKGFVKYCYNTGTITGHGVVGGNLTWQSRIGGIAGQTEPTATNQVTFTYCYNIGEIVLNITGFTSIVGISVGSDVRYGAGISGYTDRTDEISKSVTSNTTYCYTLKNCVASYLGTVSAANCKYRGEENKWDPDGDADYPDAAQPGTKVDSLADLTAYIGSDGYVRATKMIGGGERSSSQSMVGSGESGAYINTFNDETNEVTYNSFFLNGTLNGYIYIYGCIPTLAMFALGTKEGLSMMSVSYGQDENGDFVGAQAGSKQSPYIIKDGVDLLGMQTLVNASEGDSYFYTFRNKYIEFANASEGNNIDNLTVTSIDMSTLKNNYSSEANQGKNRFLYTRSAAGGGKDFPATASNSAGSNNLSGWTAKNYYFSGTSASASSGATFSDVNYLPAGYMGGDTKSEHLYRFEGSFNALGGTISNLKIVQKHDYRAYAGLFGKTKNATISNVKLTGASIKAYFTNTLDNEKDGSVAGGIVAWMGGGTTIDNCLVENSSIYAYANRSSSATNTNTTASNSYAGGIAGLIVSGRPSYNSVTYTRGTTTSITNCVVGGSAGAVTISGYGSNIGGIVGAVANKPLAYAYSPTPSGVNGTFVTLSGNKVQYSVSLSGLTSSHAQRYTGIGGIVGVVIGNDGPQTAILGCLVGRDTAADGSATTGNVTVTGAYDIGGIVGVVGGNTTIGTPEGATDYMSNCIVGKLAQIKADTYKSWSSESGRSNDYGIAVGGVVGRADSVTFNGVSYWGSITVGNTAAGAKNVGGIIGFMGTGTTFAEGARCDVTGSITISNGKSAGTDPANNQNIGGVAGSASDAAFSGTFIIQPTISLTGSAGMQNVGGFIGSNNGVIYVRARNTAIVIGGTISGTQNVGGFVGNNSSVATLNIGLSGYMGQSDTGDLYIAIGATYETTGGAVTYKPDANATITAHQNVGGLLGLNAVDSHGTAGSVVIEKGNIYNFAKVTAGKLPNEPTLAASVVLQNVGGIIGNNSGSLTTGATAASDAYSALRNYGAITGHKNVGGIIGLLDNGSVGGYFTNFGNVMGDDKGSSFVGGAIGRVSSSARIITPVDDNKLPSGDTLFRNGGMVKGTYFVGGSIGGMLGTIEGNETYQVTFRNTKLTGNLTGFDDGKTYDGTVGSLDVGDTKFGGAFIGGNIGIIMGEVKYGEFINDVEMTIDVASSSGHTSIGIGGSIGLIGNPDEMLSNFGFNDEHDELMTELATHTAINISNSQFEYSGSIEVITTDKGEQKSHTHAVGGAVGGIVQTTGVTTTFDASNTFFANGNVIAETGISVGGIVGLISANNVNIYDVLAYETRVVGLKNVGGIVGEVTGANVAVNNTFNLLGTVEHTDYDENSGLNFSETDKAEGFANRYVGGIIGKTADSTDADTSYWLLKGMSSEIIGNIVKDEKWRIKADEEGYAAASDDEDAYSTGTSHSGWYFLFANDGAIDGGGIDIYHLGDGSDDVSVRLGYWKRIANAYTIDERANELDKSFVEGIPQKVGDKFQVNGEEIVSGQLYGSQIVGRMESGSVTNGGQVTPGYLYVAAKAGAMGSFLRVDASLRASYTGDSYYGKDGEADYLHDANGLSAESIQMSPVGANGVTYFRFKINDALASSASGSGSSGGVGTNQLGNIGVYYQKIDQNIDLGSASYTGEEIEIKYEQMPDGLRALLEGSNRKDVTEVSVVGGVAQTDKDRANSYGYAFRLANISKSTGVNVDSNGDSVDKILNAGKYEGCIDIYLYDSEGVPKPVGYTNFGFVVTPAQIWVENNSDGSTKYYTGQHYSTGVGFFVTKDGAKTAFEKAVGDVNLFDEYIADLRIFFAKDGVLDENGEQLLLGAQGTGKFEAGTSNTGYKTSFGYTVLFSSRQDYCLSVTDMINVGSYQMIFDTAYAGAYKYNMPKYEDGKWTEDTSVDFPSVHDGNYYFVGTQDNTSSPSPFTFFTITQNGFDVQWKSGSGVYDNKDFEYEAATITANESFASVQLLRQELTGIVVRVSNMSGTITLDGEKDGTYYKWKDGATTKTITLILIVGKDAGEYTPSSSTARTTVGGCAITYKGTTNQFSIYQQKVTAAFYDGTSGTTAPKSSYTYNAEPQGALRATITRGSGFNASLPSNLASIAKTTSSANLTYGTGSVTGGTTFNFARNGGSVNAGSYGATITLTNDNYTFADGNFTSWGSTASNKEMTVTWTIDPYEVEVGLNAPSEHYVYDGNEHMPEVSFGGLDRSVTKTADGYQVQGLGEDMLTFVLTITGDGEVAVNAGTYQIEISQDPAKANSNYDIHIADNSQASVIIDPAQLTLTWDSDGNVFEYDAQEHGRNVLAEVTSSYKFGISGAQQLEIDGESAVLTLTNAFGRTETITFALSGDVRMKNVGEYRMRISDSQTTLVGTNAGGSSTLGNFVIAYPEADADYEIVAKQIKKAEVVGSVEGKDKLSKVYDATVEVPGEFKFAVNFAGDLDAALKAELENSYELEIGKFDNKNVGDRTIGYTLTLKSAESTGSTNFVFVDDEGNELGTVITGDVAGEITPATLTVKLRSNSPSKVYDGNVYFGGDGWTGGSGSNSKVYQANNGFSVDGFISGDSDRPQIKATFSDNRSTSSASYDSYVNGADSKKTIKFALSGSDNYVLALESGTVDSAKKSGTFNGGAITPKPIRATYRNTRQSYVTRDNKFNTEWIDIEGSLTGLVGDDARYVVLKVTNAWTSGEYKTYTVIRGSASSSLLKAEIVANASTTLGKPYDECYLNYTLTNQPVLTIGYFMSGDDFEIGSLSALLIATYYYWASTHVDDAGFNGFITQSKWVTVVSVADYDSNTGIDSKCQHDEKCSTWEEHIEKLMAEGKAIEQVGDNWGYYEASDETDRTVYTSFKQIANISGVFTADDIAILNGMFTKTTFNEDGSTNTDNSYSWGVGSKYLENVIKVAAGNNITVLDAVFLDAFGGTYDGQGYTLDGFTIIGTGNNVGFFTEVKDPATVKNVNLRNFNIITTVSENVGGLAGSAATTNSIENVTVHATINAQGATNVGGVVGSLASGSISKAIALGSIYATATNVGGIVGTASGSIEDAVSMMYIYATATNVGGIAGTAGESVDGTYMTNAVWNNGSAISGGTSKSYTDLYNGSVSGYKLGKNYKSGSDYYLSTATSESDLKGAYDVIDEVTLDDYALGNSLAPNPRESMRLADLIDVYLLLYTLEETAYNEFRVFDISETSWLVDNKHGTDQDGDRIVIANQQNVSLLRELRFAAFELTADVYMYDTYSLTPAKGAFFGSVEANDHHIYIKGRTDEEMFEALAAGVTLPIESY